MLRSNDAITLNVAPAQAGAQWRLLTFNECDEKTLDPGPVLKRYRAGSSPGRQKVKYLRRSFD
jgi:hypothetical protein